MVRVFKVGLNLMRKMDFIMSRLIIRLDVVSLLREQRCPGMLLLMTGCLSSYAFM